MRTKSGAASPNQPSPIQAAKPLLVDIVDIRVGMLGGKVGDVDTRLLMKAPGAPAPVRGGDRKGSKGLWSRAAVEAYLSKVVESGKWPTSLWVSA